MYQMREFLAIVSGTSLAQAYTSAEETLEALAIMGNADAFNKFYRETQVLRDEQHKRQYTVTGEDFGQADKWRE